MNTTGERVLEVLEGRSELQLTKEANGQYRLNSPFRLGSDSHGFVLTINSDGEHGAYYDHVTGEQGSLYDLAKRLGVSHNGNITNLGVAMKSDYENLTDYAAAHHTTADVFRSARWGEKILYQDRPALPFKTKNGTRFRFIDGAKPKYKSQVGYKSCWYRLQQAVNIARTTNQPLVICNGEPSTIVAQHFDVAATATTGGEKPTISDELLSELKSVYDGPIIIAFDCDDKGRANAPQLARQLNLAGFDAIARDLGLDNGQDLADFCGLHTRDSTEALVACNELGEPDSSLTASFEIISAGLGDKIPELPGYAQLSSKQEREAKAAGSWLDDYVCFAKEASPLTPHVFHEAAGLFAGAVAIARRLHFPVSVRANWIRPNLYMLFIGHSTKPRKSTALRVLRGLIEEAEMVHLLLADRQTPEALVMDLTTKIPPHFDEWPEEQKQFWLKERGFAAQRGWLLEEASQLLDSFNRDYSAGLLPIVLDLYDSTDHGPTKHTIARGRESIKNAYINIFGATTYAAMAEHTSKEVHWHNGLFARFALINSDDSGRWKFWPPPVEYPEELLNKLRFIAHELLPTPKINYEERNNRSDNSKLKQVEVIPGPSSAIKMHHDAYFQWNCFSRAVSFEMIPEKPDKVSPKFYASYGRLSTMLVKVAMILATFDATEIPVIVEPKHMYRAVLIVEKWRANLHTILEKTTELSQDSLADKVLRTITASGQYWLPRRDLLRSLRCKWSEIESIIADLTASELIEAQASSNKSGPKSEEYRALIEKELS